MISQEKQWKSLPDTPGVYFFKKGKNILYVGKATSLRDRVRSYFSNDLIDTRGQRIVKMVSEADNLSYKKTDSVLEALILEAHNIKTLQPPYNSLEKDDKSYNFVVITDEKFPRVLLRRGKEITSGLLCDEKARFIAGPFPNGGQLKEALKITRKIFPFRDKCIPFDPPKHTKPCFNRQIGLCPGVCSGEISSKEYIQIIKNLELFFSGRVDKVKANLKKQMSSFAKSLDFEEAEKVRRTIFALEHIRDVSLIKQGSDYSTRSKELTSKSFRIEAYDIAHISGTATVGVMTVVIDGEADKSQYRKFNIKGRGGRVKIDDTYNLREILDRRQKHDEWPTPDIIVVDGGKAQLNVAKTEIKYPKIKIVSVVKNDKHKPREIMGDSHTIEKFGREIFLANSEAHRFAINFHRKKLKNRLKS